MGGSSGKRGRVSPTPEGLDAAEVESILASLSSLHALPDRIERASAHFLGRPYLAHPLCGSRDIPERFTARLDAFDCVTFIETVLALAFARSPAEFARRLREIRYTGGVVEWAARNHYMTEWAANNAGKGWIEDLTTGAAAIEKRRVLSVVEGLPPREVRFRSFPKRSLPKLAGSIQTGDLIVFMSLKRRLDAFHAGVLVKRDAAILLRHATRSVGCIVEEPLRDFLATHRMAGFMLLRPIAPRRGGLGKSITKKAGKV